MKWLKAAPQQRIEYTIAETPLLHACCGKDSGFGDITFDGDITMQPMVLGDVKTLPFKDDSFSAAFMDCPWASSWKSQLATTMKELLRVAPVAYVISPWTWGNSMATMTAVSVAWTPGVNQALIFARYERKKEAGGK